MPIALPQPVRTLLENKAYGHVVTFTAKGQPRLTMVWMDVDGDEVLFNTAEGRKKPQDLRRDPRVIVSDKYPVSPTETRLLVRISVDRISGIGPGYKSWV
jgi:Pyridoxamine 5'-phosphate oxidase